MFVSQNNRVVQVFDEWARNGRSDIMAAGHAYAVEQMFQLFAHRYQYRFLDIGSGNGWVVRKASTLHQCAQAVGIDASSEMIELGNTRKFDNKEQFIHADFLQWQTKQTYDVILSMETFYYITPINQALEKVHTLLDSNGLFIFGIDFYQENGASHHWPDMVGLTMQLRSSAEWCSLFEEAGFKEVTTNFVKNDKSKQDWQREHGTLVICGAK